MLITSAHNMMLLEFDYHMKCEAFSKHYSRAVISEHHGKVISEYHGKVISEYQIPAISWKLQLYQTSLNSDVEKCVLISAEIFPIT